MFPTAARLSKASRAPLTPKRGNKDFYKGTRQAFLPGGPRTGAPGRHVIRGKAKYRLLDDKVRVFVAPPIAEIESSLLKPYVAVGKKLSPDQEIAVFGKYRGPRGLTPEHFLRIAREHTYARMNPEDPCPNPREPPAWMNAQRRLNIADYATGISVREGKPVESAAQAPEEKIKELEVVVSKETAIATTTPPRL